MAVAHDQATESHTGTTGSASEASFSFSHDPVGTPRGVLVFVFTNADAADISSVTYDGVTVPAVAGGEAIDANGELGRCKAFFLGSGVPATDPATVVVNRTNNADVMYAVCITVTAGGDTYIAGTPVLLQEDGTLAEQSVVDGSNGVNSLRYAGVNSGLVTPPAQGSNSTQLHTIDFSARGISVCRETTAGQGSRSVGFSSGTTDDRSAVHVAVGELVPVTITPLVAALIGAGVAAVLVLSPWIKPDPAVLFFGLQTSFSVTPPTGALDLAGIIPSLLIDQRVNPSTGALALSSVAPSVVSGTFAAPATQALVLVGQAPSLLTDSIRGPPPGSLVLTGNPPTLQVPGDTAITPQVGAIALSGASAVPSQGILIAPSTGQAVFGIDAQNPTPISASLILAGLPASLVQDARATPSQGTLALTGNQAVIQGQTAITPSVGSLVLTASASSMGLDIFPAQGSLVFAGAAPTLIQGAAIIPDSGAIAQAGNSPHLDLTVLTPSGVLVLTGSAPVVEVPGSTSITPAAGQLFLGLGVDVLRTPGTGSMVIAGQAPVASLGSLSKTPSAASIILTGSAPTISLLLNTSITPGTGSLIFDVGLASPPPGQMSLTGQAPRLNVGMPTATGSLVLTPVAGSAVQGRPITPGIGSLALTPSAPVLLASGFVTPATGALTLTSHVPTLRQDHQVTPAVGSLVLTGQAPQITTAVAVGTGQLQLTGQAPVLSTPAQAVPAAGTLALTGSFPIVGGAITIAPATGVLVTSGSAAGVVSQRIVVPSVGSLSVTGTSPLVLAGQGAFPGAGTLALTGAVPTLGLQGLIIPGSGQLSVQGAAVIIGTEGRIIVNTAQLELTGLPAIRSAETKAFPGSGGIIVAGELASITTAAVIAVPAERTVAIDPKQPPRGGYRQPSRRRT